MVLKAEARTDGTAYQLVELFSVSQVVAFDLPQVAQYAEALQMHPNLSHECTKYTA